MRFMLSQSPAQVPVKYVSVQCRGGAIAVLYGNINIYIHTHVIKNNLRTPQLAGKARQLGCKNLCTYMVIYSIQNSVSLEPESGHQSM